MSDRIAIETGICRGESFKRIAARKAIHTDFRHTEKAVRTRIF